ncbi:MAG: phage tail protein, partial [Clostridia bacterium]|nr:phage tail protein [Clostridia bacterium]
MTKFAKTLGSGIKTAAKWGAGIAAAAGTAIAALLGVDEATREYRENMAKLNTAWESAGYSVKTAKEAYDGLYKIMGDSDAATEASQLLASVAQNAQDVAKWTDIAAGVSGAFGDALPIESLIEAANETQKVGQVTGALADALNWAGISEDEFNAKLEALGSEQERNALITQTLTETYKASTEAYKANNAETLAARDAQLLLDEAMAKLGQQVANVKTALQSEFLPVIAEVIGAFMEFAKGTEGASKALQQSVKKMIDKIVEKLPDFMNFGIEVISSIAMGIIWSLPDLIDKVPA